MKFRYFLFLSIVSVFSLSIPAAAQNSGSESVLSVVKIADAKTNLDRPRVIKTDEKIAETTKTDKNSGVVFILERQVFEMVNQKRAEQNLEPLVWSDEVAKIARIHSQNMANYKFFSHAGLDGTMVSDRADQFGIGKWRAIGENIAYNQGFKNPLKCAVEGWMHSPAHKENLLSTRWKDSAIGIAVTEDGTYYFTQVFLDKK